MARAATWIHQLVRPAPLTDESALDEGPEVERLEIQDGSRRRISSVEDLESPIQPEAVHGVGTDPPTYRVGALQHEHLSACGVELAGRGQPCEAGADHDHIGAHMGSTVPCAAGPADWTRGAGRT